MTVHCCTVAWHTSQHLLGSSAACAATVRWRKAVGPGPLLACGSTPPFTVKLVSKEKLSRHVPPQRLWHPIALLNNPPTHVTLHTTHRHNAWIHSCCRSQRMAGPPRAPHRRCKAAEASLGAAALAHLAHSSGYGGEKLPSRGPSNLQPTRCCAFAPPISPRPRPSDMYRGPSQQIKTATTAASTRATANRLTPPGRSQALKRAAPPSQRHAPAFWAASPQKQ